jgi:hypothetical protein
MRWRDRSRAFGKEGLKVRSSPGRPSRLSQLQKKQLLEFLLQGPSTFGWRTQVWTTSRIAQLIEKQFQEIEQCTPEKLRETVVGYKLHDLQGYWKNLPLYFFGMSIFLDKEEWLDVVLDGIEKEHVYVENRVRSCALAMRDWTSDRHEKESRLPLRTGRSHKRTSRHQPRNEAPYAPPFQAVRSDGAM